MVKQHADFGLKNTMPLIGEMWLYDEALWPAMGDAVVGAMLSTIFFPDAPNPGAKKFVAAFKKKFGMEPDVNAALGYDNANAVLHTIETLKGKKVDGDEFIRTLTNLEIESPRGGDVLRFNKDNNGVLPELFLLKIVKKPDGKLRQELVDTFPGGHDLPGCTKNLRK